MATLTSEKKTKMRIYKSMTKKSWWMIPVMVLLSLATGYAQKLGEEIVVELSQPDEEGTLKLHLIEGSITVTAHDGKEVIITPSESTYKSEWNCDCDDDHDHHWDRDDEDEEDRLAGLRKIETGGNFNITVNQNDNYITISSDSWNTPIDYDIKVPRDFNLNLKATNNGNISVRGVRGNHEISNVNGAITMEKISGSLIANTVNENITVDFVDVDEDQPMAFTSLNGDLDLTFPTQVGFNIKLQSRQGDVYTDFDWQPVAVDPKVERSGSGGTRRIKIENWTYGKINGGGVEYYLKTTNGDIILRKAK